MRFTFSLTTKQTIEIELDIYKKLALFLYCQYFRFYSIDIGKKLNGSIIKEKLLISIF